MRSAAECWTKRDEILDASPFLLVGPSADSAGVFSEVVRQRKSLTAPNPKLGKNFGGAQESDLSVAETSRRLVGQCKTGGGGGCYLSRLLAAMGSSVKGLYR